MVMDLNRTTEARLALIDLDLSKPEDKQIYLQHRREFIGANESNNPDGDTKSYDDGKGNISVGFGFNMDADNARDEWDAAFKNTVEKDRPDFDKVYNGKAEMTKEQINTLFDHSADAREANLQQRYGESWDRLKPNEKLGLLDMEYNGGKKLGGSRTQFFSNINEYVNSGKDNQPLLKNPEFLNNALWEVKDNSLSGAERKDPKISAGMQNRRDVQAEMLNTNEQNLDSLSKPAYVIQREQEGVPHSENVQSPIAAKLDAVIAQLREKGLNRAEVNGYADTSPDNKNGVQNVPDIQYQSIAASQTRDIQSGRGAGPGMA